MRFGPLEIVIIAVVILIIFGATRLKNAGEKLGGGSGSGGESSSGSSAATRTVARKARLRHPRLQAFGILVIIGGAILVGLSFGIIKAVANIAIWGGAIIFVGAAIVIISRQR